MCLAIPGKVVEINDSTPADTDLFRSALPTAHAPFRTGRVSFGGIVKEVSLAYVPEARVGDYVIVHVGFAISTLNEVEANRVFEYLREMDELRELEVAEGAEAAEAEKLVEGVEA